MSLESFCLLQRARIAGRLRVWGYDIRRRELVHEQRQSYWHRVHALEDLVTWTRTSAR